MSSESTELDLGIRLDNITLKNFRCFESLIVDLHPNLNVLIAKNGAGKTTILDALRIAAWPYVKGFDLGSQTGKSATIQIDDVRLQKQTDGNMEAQRNSEVSATGLLGTNEATWMVYRESVKANTNSKLDRSAKALTDQAKEHQLRVSQGTKINLPLISYLGTGRLWYEGRYTSNATDVTLDQGEYSRLSGYLNCLTQSSSFKQFKDWYGWISRSHLEERILALDKNQDFEPVGSRFAAAIHVVQRSINDLITEQTGWRDISYSAQYSQQLVLRHAEHGVLPLELLSDGLRNMVAMVADIAFRCIKLNPHFGRDAAKCTSGIVMIDEVDMFLHPQWQQTVIGSLRTAFPKIQFIVTTHSPQVLSTVPSESIRILDNGQVYAAPQGTKGAESSRLLERVFGTDSRPKNDENTVLLNTYLDLVYKDQFEAAAARRPKLDEIFGNEEPALIAADLYIENRQWELGLEEN